MGVGTRVSYRAKLDGKNRLFRIGRHLFYRLRRQAKAVCRANQRLRQEKDANWTLFLNGLVGISCNVCICKDWWCDGAVTNIWNVEASPADGLGMGGMLDRVIVAVATGGVKLTHRKRPGRSGP